jgi:hypothetical protein
MPTRNRGPTLTGHTRPHERLRETRAVKTWVDEIVPSARGLLFVGGPKGRGVDLAASADNVLLTHRDARLVLDYCDFATKRPWGHRSAWALGYWGGGREQGIGIDGPATLDPIRESITRLPRAYGWNPYNPTLHEFPLVPLWAPINPPMWVPSQRSMVEALLSLLRDRPPLRTRLNDERTVEQLSSDLKRVPTSPSDIAGVTPTSGSVRRALHALGYTFRYGRPLPCDPRDPIETVIAKVHDKLRNGAPRADIAPDRLRNLVAAAYIDVQPWPFSALGV